MQFLREDQSAAAQAIAAALCDGLFAGKRVLWLVSGGSNVLVEKHVMDMVRSHANGKLGGLAILPIDERFGKPGHVDSNFEQLRAAGFDAGEATWIDVLVHDLPFNRTVGFYKEIANAAFTNANAIISQYGMGADGHIAGIKPGSPAAEPLEAMVVGYEWEDYTRMTLMPVALRQATANFVVAYGADKKKPLEQLKKKALPYKELPAMLLYELSDVYIFNDQMGAKPKR